MATATLIAVLTHQAAPTAATGPATELVVRIDAPISELAGALVVAGQPPRKFTGWLELVAALDNALDTLQRVGSTNRGSEQD